MVGSAVCVGGVSGTSVFVGATVLGGVFGGVTRACIGGCLSYPPPVAITVSGCVYAVCAEAEYRKIALRPQGAIVYTPDEVITAQPKSESGSTTPESEPVIFEPAPSLTRTRFIRGQAIYIRT
ncbi:MAG: hypothetical protein OXF02_03425 [Simkaniaceae bacterium]|nr:hypothetical protein [Simkaniaceae bacterium]